MEELIRFIEQKEKTYTSLQNNDGTADDHFFRGCLTALGKVKDKINEIKEVESREYHNHMHCQDGRGQV